MGLERDEFLRILLHFTQFDLSVLHGGPGYPYQTGVCGKDGHAECGLNDHRKDPPPFITGNQGQNQMLHSS